MDTLIGQDAFHHVGPTFINAYCFGVAIHYLGHTFINAYIGNLLQTWLIETEGNMGEMICLGQISLHSPGALSGTGGRLMFCKHLLQEILCIIESFYLKHRRCLQI